MRTLPRYVTREWARNLALCWLGLSFAYLLVEFFGRLDEFLSAQVAVPAIALYLAASLPQALILCAPMAALLAAVVTAELMARHNELVALQALGVAPRAVLRPLLAAGLALSLALLAFGELVAPAANRTAEAVWDTQVAGQKQPSFAAGRTWYRGQGTIYSFRFANHEGAQLFGLTIWRLSPEHFRLGERLDAREARYLGRGSWEVTSGLRQGTGPEGDLKVERFERLRLRLPEKPADFAAGERNPQEMSATELWRFARRLEHEGYDASRFLVDVQAKIAFALGTGVLVGLGLVFSLRPHRGGMAAAIGFSLLAAFLFWVSQAVLVSLGRTGMLPWWLAPWGADLLFGLAAWRLWARGASPR